MERPLTERSPAEHPATARGGRALLAIPAGIMAAVAAIGLAGLLSPAATIFTVLMLALLFLRQPVVLLLAAATAFTHAWFARNSSIEYLIQDMWFTADREVLLAIPMFVLAGALMTRGSIAQRLIDVMVAFTGPIAVALKRGVLAMFLPVLLLGGIYSGYFSPTESAAVSLAYAFAVELLVHRELRLADYGTVLLDTVKMLGTLLPLIAVANSLNTILDYEGIAKSWVQFVQANVSSPAAVMVGMNLLLLVVGCLMDVGSAILIFAPLLMPIAKGAGIDPVHLGIIMTANLEIGYLTPPVGLNLIVAMAAFRENFAFICRAVLPFIALMLGWLVVVCAWPPLALYLVGK